MIRLLLLLVLSATAFGQSVFVKDPATADSLGASATVLNTFASPVYTLGSGSYNPSSDTVVTPGVRRTRAQVIGTTSYNMDLMEPARSNLLTAGTDTRFDRWTAVAGGTATADTTAAPDGDVIAQTLTDPGASLSGVSQSITVANDSLIHTFAIFVLKTSGGTAPTFGVDLALSVGTGVTTSARINTDTGAQAYGSNSNVVVTANSTGLYWRVAMQVTNNTTGNTTLTLTLYPAAAAYGASVDSAAATGTAVCAFADLAKVNTAGTYSSNRNLLVQSQTLGTSWTLARSTITSDSTANPIDGATNADTINDDNTAANTHLIRQDVSKAASAIQYTFSSYIKQSGVTWVELKCGDTGDLNTAAQYFDVANGVKGTGLATGTGWTLDAAAITAVGSWYRCSITITASTATTMRNTIYTATGDLLAIHNGINGSALIGWGAQLVYGAKPMNYWGTTSPQNTRAVGALTTTMTSISDARTNRLTYSEQIDNAAWTKTDTTITANSAMGPFGGTGGSFADLCTEGVAGTANITQVGASITAGQSITFSEYFKAGTATFVTMTANNGSDILSGWFNISAGATGSATNGGTASGASVAITNLQNGWYRCALSGVVNAGSTAITLALHSATADASSTRLANATYTVFGAQFEQAATVGLYLPVAGAAVSAPQSGTSTTSGTLIAVVRPYGWFSGDTGTAWTALDGNQSGDEPRLTRTAATTLGANTRDSAGAQGGNVTTAMLNGTNATFGLTWDYQSVLGYYNGVLGATDSVIVAPYLLATAIKVGCSPNAAREVCGYSLAFYWNKNVLTPAQQQIFANGVAP